MTTDEYRAAVRALGLTPHRVVSDGGMIHEDGQGDYVNVPDPERLTPEKRAAFIDFLRMRMGG